MKKTILGLSLFISSFAVAQNGLERIIVEKYYIANAADAAQATVEAGNPLPSGSITYRVYADMAPGFGLVYVYADVVNGHKLKFRTTTSFYNHADGDVLASSKKADLANSLLALDSYLTLGGAATNAYGILKADDDGTANNITTTNNTPGILLNTTSEMGVPLTTNDGLIAGTGIIKPSQAGISNELNAFGDGTTPGDSVVLVDGSIYTSTPAVGPVPADNRVLIAQLTTNGSLSFELNILVKGPDGTPQFFVANNPGKTTTGSDEYTEYTIPSLTYPDKTTGILTPGIKTYNEVLFSVYPNPVSDHVTVELTPTEPNSKGSYTIYGVIGNVILHKELNGISGSYKETVDMSALAKGLYTIQMNVNGVSSTKKIIKN